MRDGSRPRARRFLELTGICAAAPLLLGAHPAGTKVSVTATNLRSSEGVVHACLSADPKRFTSCEADARAYKVTVPAARQVEFDFAGVQPGRYAIVLAHDENHNGMLDRALGLVPKEGFGFSRDAPVRMGPPRFEDAAIVVGSEPAHYTVRMRYIL